MFDAYFIKSLLNSLLEDIDLGFIAVPMIVLLSAIIIIFGVGLRKSWLSFSGVFVIFSYYFLLEVVDADLLELTIFS